MSFTNISKKLKKIYNFWLTLRVNVHDGKVLNFEGLRKMLCTCNYLNRTSPTVVPGDNAFCAPDLDVRSKQIAI